MRRAATALGVFLLAAALLPVGLRAEPTRRALALSEALELALKLNPEVARAHAEVTAASAQKRAALSLVLPRLGATGGLIDNSKEVTFGSGSDSRTILPEHDWNLRLTLNQPIFAGLREKRAYQQAKEGLTGAREGLRGAEDRVLLRVAGEYLTVAGADGLLDVETRALQLAEARRRQAQDLYDAGETTRVDVLRAVTAIKAAERRVASAQQLRETAVGQLRVDLGLEGDVAVEAAPAAPTPAPPDEPALVASAEQSRPELAQAQAALRSAGFEIQKQWGAYLPVITADAGYIWQKTSFPADRYGYAALRFSVPLFQGGEVGARVAQARARERQAQLALEETRRSVREDVRKALLDARTAVTNLALAQEQLAAAEAEYADVFESYRSQEATALDVETSETSLAEAQRAVVKGRLDRTLADLGVWYAAGGLKAAILDSKEVAR